MNPLKAFLKFVKTDLKEDWLTLNEMMAGKAKLQIPKEDLFKGWDKVFKKYWTWFLLIILAVVVGYGLGFNVGQTKMMGACYDFINQTVYAGSVHDNLFHNFSEFVKNLTMH